VRTAERNGQILEELRAVHEDTNPNAVEYLDGETATIGIGFQHQEGPRRSSACGPWS
jgi:hypothetical protein